MIQQFEKLNEYLISYPKTSKQTDSANEIAAKMTEQAELIKLQIPEQLSSLPTTKAKRAYVYKAHSSMIALTVNLAYSRIENGVVDELITSLNNFLFTECSQYLDYGLRPSDQFHGYCFKQTELQAQQIISAIADSHVNSKIYVDIYEYIKYVAPEGQTYWDLDYYLQFISHLHKICVEDRSKNLRHRLYNQLISIDFNDDEFIENYTNVLVNPDDYEKDPVAAEETIEARVKAINNIRVHSDMIYDPVSMPAKERLLNSIQHRRKMCLKLLDPVPTLHTDLVGS